ncbi:hypothetical protein CsSME_00026253 [Camellia sinensis var. sinensis]
MIALEKHVLTHKLEMYLFVRRLGRFLSPAEMEPDTVDSVVYLVDAHDKKRFAEAKKELDALISDDSLANVPFLILGNKIDIPYAASEDELRYYLGLTGVTTIEEWKKQANVRSHLRTVLLFFWWGKLS